MGYAYTDVAITLVGTEFGNSPCDLVSISYLTSNSVTRSCLDVSFVNSTAVTCRIPAAISDIAAAALRFRVYVSNQVSALSNVTLSVLGQSTVIHTLSAIAGHCWLSHDRI